MAKCNAITHVAFLKREDFISLLKEFPEDATIVKNKLI